MKLYFSNELYGGLPSPWTEALFPIRTGTYNGSEHNNKNFLSDNKILPCYLLKTTPPARGVFNADGQAVQPSSAVTFEHTFYPAFKMGIAMKGSGTISRQWVTSNTMWAQSSIRTRSWGGNSSGLAIMCPFVYVYRPSTQATVGFLMKPQGTDLALNNIGYNSNTMLHTNNTDSPNRALTWSGWCGSQQDTLWIRSDVAFQDGDMIIWEFWGYPQIGGVGVPAAGTYNYTLRFDIGGTGTDQVYSTFTSSSSLQYNTFLYLDDLQSMTQGFYATPQGVGTPALTQVNPVGDGVECVFDNPVTISPSLTLGAPAAGLRALGASDTSNVIKKLNIRPVPPSVNLGF